MITHSSQLAGMRDQTITSIAHGQTALVKVTELREFAWASRISSALAILQQVESEMQARQFELSANQR